MEKIFDRTRLLIGDEGLDILKNAKVCVFGLGGVGSFTVEALARAGVGHLLLVDFDVVDITNINRQLHATMSTIGKSKVELMKDRINDINPMCKVKILKEFCTPENIFSILEERYDYIVDAIDTVKSKLAIIEYAKNNNISVISSMGTANKLSNKNFEVVDIKKTHTCPLAKVMRKELKAKGISEGVKVVYSTDPSIKVPQNGKNKVLGSISFVPPVAGFILAGEVINDLLIDTYKEKDI